MADNNPQTEQDEGVGGILAFLALAAGAGIAKELYDSAQRNNKKNEVEKVYQAGVASMHNGQYSDAVQTFLSVLKKDPKHAAAYNQLAWALATDYIDCDPIQYAQNLVHAEEYAKSAIDLAGSLEEYAMYGDTLAEVWFRQQRYDIASQAFRACLELSKDTVDTYSADYSASFRLALCLLNMNLVSQAQESLGHALQLGPKNPRPYLMMADLYLNQQRYHSSIRYYEQAIALSESWNFNYPLPMSTGQAEQRAFFLATCWCNIGVAYYYVGDDDKAWYAGDKSAQLRVIPNPFVNLASLVARVGDPGAKAKVRAYLEEALSLFVPQRDWYLIANMINEPELEQYRDVVLGLLSGYGLIPANEYQRQFQVWLQRQGQHKQTGATANTTNVHNYLAPISTLNAAYQPQGGVNMTTDGSQNNSSSRSYNSGGGPQYNAEHGDQNVQTGGTQYRADHGNISIGSIQTVGDFVSELRRLKTELDQAEKNQQIGKRVTVDARYHLEKAALQAEEAQPQKQSIISHLNSARETLSAVGSMASIVNALSRLGDIAHHIF